jgi:hypothetical protein
MKKPYILLLVAISIASVNAEEKFSIQFNPLLPLLTIGCNIDIDIDIMPDKESKESKHKNRPLCLLADLQFQYAINKKFALFISPSFTKENGGFTATGRRWDWIIDEKGVALELMSSITTYYRNNELSLITGLLYHPYETGLRGMYLGTFPVIGWGYITKDGKIIKNFLNIGSMAEIGYEWIRKKGLTLTLGAGICKIHQIPSSPSVFAPEINEVIEFSKDNNSLYGVNLGGLPFDVRLRFSIGYSF